MTKKKVKIICVIVLISILSAGAYFVFIKITFRNDPVQTGRIINTQPNPRTDDKVILIFTGDVVLARDIGRIIKENNPDFPFLLVRDFLRDADVIFANLENPVSKRGVKIGSIYSFRADPEDAAGLSDAHFNIVNIANNHIWDYGKDAFRDTLDFLAKSGVDFIGGGENYQKAHTPVIKNIRGTKIAFLGYTKLVPRSITREGSRPAIAYLDEDKMLEDITAAKSQADIVVVSFHWGDEYQTGHNQEQEKIAREAIDAGASLVVGHHPHAVQEFEKYRDGYIAYSLGNFIFDQNFSPETNSGLILEVMAREKKIAEIKPIKIYFNSFYQPYLATSTVE